MDSLETLNHREEESDFEYQISFTRSAFEKLAVNVKFEDIKEGVGLTLDEELYSVEYSENKKMTLKFQINDNSQPRPRTASSTADKCCSSSMVEESVVSDVEESRDTDNDESWVPDDEESDGCVGQKQESESRPSKKLSGKRKHESTQNLCKKRVKCEAEGCSKIFSTKYNMKVHFDSVHLNKDFICDICGAWFNYKSNLNRHYGTYHPERRKGKAGRPPRVGPRQRLSEKT